MVYKLKICFTISLMHINNTIDQFHIRMFYKIIYRHYTWIERSNKLYGESRVSRYIVDKLSET